MNQRKLHSQRTQSVSKSIRFLSLLLTTIIFLTCFASCKRNDDKNQPTPPTNEELITERIETFLTAYNDGDMEVVLECLDAKTRNAFQAMLNILGGLAGSAAGFNIDLSDLFSLGVSTTSGDFMELEITDITVIDSTNATATTKMFLTGSGAQIIYFEMVYENNGWYIHDMADEQTKDTINNSNQTGTNISVLDMGATYNANAEIEFEMNDKTYSGIINSKGEIIYYSEESRINWTSIGNGAGFVTTYTGDDTEIYDLFNEYGHKTFTADGDVFDSIIGYGDGLVLVYKNTSSITNEEHSYGILDSNGNWIKPLTVGPTIPLKYPSGTLTYKYYGDGVFISCSSNTYILFNTRTNLVLKLIGCTVFSDELVNGVIYAKANSGGSVYYSYNTPDEYSIVLRDWFALHSDGRVEQLSEFKRAYNNLLINTTGEYMRILDRVSNVETEYTVFPSEMISFVEFDGDFGLVILNGADGKTYFTVIDKECNQKVAPIVCSSATISDGRIVYKNSDNIYEVIDVNGTEIVSKNQGFTYISDYRGGMAKAKNSAGECYIGLDGKPLTIKLK